ncbi:myb-like protein P [Mercenaria mercenaria]|uniref:myb-like protein P n=1 Tax=Mercenaria mercenaria TaxID=6596 RepID=UPI00234E3776|nr:myb-like protein P [Mercenaria mercenaria]
MFKKMKNNSILIIITFEKIPIKIFQITNRPNNIPEQEFYRRQQLQQQSGQNGNNPYGNTQNPYGQNQYGNQNNQYGNQNNQYGNQNNQYGNQNNYGNNQYGNNQYGNNQYGNNQYGNNQYGSSSYYGTCGSAINVCQFTVFVPNGTAVYNYYMTSLGNQITRDLPRYRWVLRRLIIPNQLVFIEQLPVSSQSYRYTAHNGDQLILRKESENTVRLSWSGMSARVIMSDLGATNGVVHIIDTVLSQLSDQTVDISASTALSGNFCVFGLIAFTLCLLHKLWR